MKRRKKSDEANSAAANVDVCVILGLALVQSPTLNPERRQSGVTLSPLSGLPFLASL